MDIPNNCAPKCKTLKHIRKYSNPNNPDYIDETIDPYHWLTDKENPEVIEYLKAENNYTTEVMSDCKDLQNEIFNEIKTRIKEDDTSAPWQQDDYSYYFKTVKDQEYSIFCRKKNNNQLEEILINENELAKVHDFFNIGDIEVSPCNNFIAYTADTVGNEQYELFLKDIEDNKTINISNINNIGLVSADVTWSADSNDIIYIKLDDNLRPYKVYVYNLQNQNHFVLYTEDDERFWVSANLTRTKSFILLNSQSKLSTEVQYLPAAQITEQSKSKLKIIKPREQHIEYYADHYCDINTNTNYFYILINSKEKPNFELHRYDINSNSGSSNWELLIKHNITTKLSDLECFKNYCVLFTRENGLNHLYIVNNYDFNKISKLEVEQIFNEQVFNIEPGHNEMFNQDHYVFEYESLATPHGVYSLDTTKNNTNSKENIKLIKQDEVLLGFKSDDYISERVFVEIPNSTDSIYNKVPVSIIYNKNKYKKDGQHGMLLYGYGSYGISIDPYFSHSRISLLDRGIAFAITHIRGGGELGETWHHNGRLDCKENTFTDFINTAKFLIANNYTSPNKLAIQGGSAGGLLIGNVINQAPELFKVAIAEVPFVDCLNTMLDPDLPLTITEYEEWGNPTANIDVYEYIKSYAPYENIKAQNYPNLLINNSLEDCRVSYFEAAKWAAKLRANKTDSNTLLLKTQMTAGHGGPSGRYQAIHDVAFNFSFILKYLNS